MSYRIKPLEWVKTEGTLSPDLREVHEASTLLCNFVIQKMQSSDWYYHFCFAEYYDDGAGSCENLEDGKNICEKIWEDRLKKCLIKEKEN